MKVQPDWFSAAQYESPIEYRHVIAIHFADDGSDTVWFTSHSDALLPSEAAGATVIHGAVEAVSAQSQSFDPKSARHSIGNLRVQLNDLGGLVGAEFKARFENGVGLRGKRVVYYQGLAGAPSFDDGYCKRFTYALDSTAGWQDGIYSLSCSSAHRLTKKTIFTPHQGELVSTIDEVATEIPVSIPGAVDKFPLARHTGSYTDRPGELVGYIRIEDEVIAHSGWTDATYTKLAVLERGALSTRPAVHEGTTAKPIRVTEYIYLEMPTPALIKALITGVQYGTTDVLPAHWNCGVDASWIDDASFDGIGNDLWDGADGGKISRIIGAETTNAKDFIEKELLRRLPGFLAIDADGRFVLRRISAPLPYSDYQFTITDQQIISFREYTERENDVINTLSVDWGWIDIREKFAKRSVVIDTESKAKYAEGIEAHYEFKTLFPGLHSDEDIQVFFDQIRNRYAAPPLLWEVTCTPDCAVLDQGDIARVVCSVVEDYRAGTTVDRAFEVLGVTADYFAGTVKLTLFGSTEPAAPIPVSGDYVFADSFYNTGVDGDGNNRTALSSVLSISNGSVTADGTITGDAASHYNAIYVHQGDLTIPDGVTVSISENVQIRVMGTLVVNGRIEGVGGGKPGRVYSTTGNPTGTGLAADGSVTLYSVHSRGLGAISVSGGAKVGARFEAWDTAFLNTDSPVKFNGGLSEAAIENPDGLVVRGIPDDLRGPGGGSGSAIVDAIGITGNWQSPNIIAPGGDGGDGGAGLAIIARGMAFGASGEVDLSGTAGTAGGSGTLNGVTFYGSTGASGGPGNFFYLNDGAAALPTATSIKQDAIAGPAPGGQPYVPQLCWMETATCQSTKFFASGESVGRGDVPALPVHAGGVDRLRAIRYAPYARNGYRWFPPDEAAAQPGYGEKPPTWTEVRDDGKKPEDNANLVTGTAQIADDANLGQLAAGRYNGQPQTSVNENITIKVNNAQGAVGWYKVAACRLTTSYDSWNFNGYVERGGSSERYWDQHRVSMTVQTGSSSAVLGLQRVLVSSPDEAEFNGMFKLQRVDNGDGTYTWELYVRLPSWNSVRLRGVWTIGGGTPASESWYNDLQTQADSLGDDATFTPPGVQIANQFNYEPGATLGADWNANINGQPADDDILNERLFKTADLIVTVGAGGDYTSINEALTVLSASFPKYLRKPIQAIIRVKDGYVLDEPIVVSGNDFSWIKLQPETNSASAGFSADVDAIAAALEADMGAPLSYDNPGAVIFVRNSGVAPEWQCKIDLTVPATTRGRYVRAVHIESGGRLLVSVDRNSARTGTISGFDGASYFSEAVLVSNGMLELEDGATVIAEYNYDISIRVSNGGLLVSRDRYVNGVAGRTRNIRCSDGGKFIAEDGHEFMTLPNGQNSTLLAERNADVAIASMKFSSGATSARANSIAAYDGARIRINQISYAPDFSGSTVDGFFYARNGAELILNQYSVELNLTFASGSTWYKVDNAGRIVVPGSSKSTNVTPNTWQAQGVIIA